MKAVWYALKFIGILCLFVLWTEYAWQQGVNAATQECEWGAEYEAPGETSA